MPIPSPLDNSEVWDTLTLGSGVLPPIASEGNVEVKVQAKANLDAKRTGGGKPSTTKTGRELAEVTITLRFNESIWSEVEAAILRLQPGSGPHKIGHPKTRLAGVDSVSIESYDGPDWDDYTVGTVVWHCKEWAPPPVETAKRTVATPETPKAAVPFDNVPWGVPVAQKGIADRFREAAARAVEKASKP
jgi:hypothetical protein